MFKLKDKIENHGGGNGGGPGGGTGGGGMGSTACYIYPRNTAEEPVIVPNPDKTFNRSIYMNGSMLMDDGTSVSIWGFSGQNLDKNGQVISYPGGSSGMSGMGGMMDGAFPSVPMRITEGELAHTVLNVMGGGMMWRHTVHHHGIEPEYRSDGVGHTSWDVTGTYTYQWRPSQAGTYFYHCHTNTVLHAEMGMYGALIVDPPEGQGTAFAGGPTYDLEAIWAVDEIDPSWHKSPQNWSAGTCGGDAGLNELNPKYFIISGVDGNQSASQDSSNIPVNMTVGQTLLIRYINAGYLPQQLKLGGLQGSIIASDGRPLPNARTITTLDTVSAERYDILIQPTSADIGNHVIEFDILDWVTNKVLGTAKTRIIVSA